MVEILKANQRREELEMTIKTYREMLAAISSTPEAKRMGLEKPRANEITLPAENRRPELALFDAQINLITSQESGIKASTMPRFNLFLQGGYGNPGLNMLKNEFSAYYIGGVRLAWNFGSFYTKGNSIKKLESSRESVKVLRETFLFNNSLAETQQRNEVDKLARQLSADDEIITLRINIKNAAETKAENGTLSVSDLLREINALNMARQEKATHEIMHLMAIYSIKYLKNN
jgi:outer membrane protein TolC